MPDKLYVYVYSQRALHQKWKFIHTSIHTYPIHNCHVIIGIRRWLTKKKIRPRVWFLFKLRCLFKSTDKVHLYVYYAVRWHSFTEGSPWTKVFKQIRFFWYLMQNLCLFSNTHLNLNKDKTTKVKMWKKNPTTQCNTMRTKKPLLFLKLHKSIIKPWR